MPRVRPGHATRRRHKKILRAAKGFWGSRSKLFRSAKQFVIKARVYAFRDRRVRKREFRGLWIIRVSAACEQRGLSYSKFIAGLKKAGVFLNRKMLSEVAIADPAAFDKLVELARAHATAAA
ncbi:MAG TPA: 50S ribosomal protein L20 [Phycisphaerae bacterium]|jgi:large subunit ribosomal protein L20|nr:50S ribosomal protein L20 [Phycisphaerae bacterium]HPM23608.1 50S ribosomal protein L20 [Phycisphaerae bacterium]